MVPGWLDKDGSAATVCLSPPTQSSWYAPYCGSEAPRRVSGPGPFPLLPCGRQGTKLRAAGLRPGLRQPPSELRLLQWKNVVIPLYAEIADTPGPAGAPASRLAWGQPRPHTGLSNDAFQNTPCSKPGPEY